jgi:hypothetical protein
MNDSRDFYIIKTLITSNIFVFVIQSVAFFAFAIQSVAFFVQRIQSIVFFVDAVQSIVFFAQTNQSVVSFDSQSNSKSMSILNVAHSIVFLAISIQNFIILRTTSLVFAFVASFDDSFLFSLMISKITNSYFFNLQ